MLIFVFLLVEFASTCLQLAVDADAEKQAFAKATGR
jgi:hypothetical protein